MMYLIANAIGVYLIVGMVMGAVVTTKLYILDYDDSQWEDLEEYDLSYKEKLVILGIGVLIVAPVMPIAYIIGIIKKYYN